MDLGNNIQIFRKKLRLSQEKLGEAVGVTRQTVSNWECNSTVPDAYQLIALAKALQVSLDTLVGNSVDSLLIEKVNNVETEVEKANNLLKISIYILVFVILLLLFVFISSN
uniref:helix-turn-helix domain-containing protein n=1 Tax=Thomasclavelia ramosa TaxID=1547 RepID=UPI00402A97A6